MDLPGCNLDVLWNLRLRDTVAASGRPHESIATGLGLSATLGCDMQGSSGRSDC
jgi:hypothetical protein